MKDKYYRNFYNYEEYRYELLWSHYIDHNCPCGWKQIMDEANNRYHRFRNGQF